MAPPSIQKARMPTGETALQEPQTTSDLTVLLTELSTKSKLDEFRLFFDLKSGPWDRLRNQLNNHVQSLYSWPDLRDNENRRRLCATEFLEEFGIKYWGDANRDKTLIEGRLEVNDACRYPQDKRPMVDALALLLEKSSKSKRTSIAPNVSGSCPDDIDAAAPVTGKQTVEPTLNDNQRDPPTIASIEVIKGPPTPKEEAAEGPLASQRVTITGALVPHHSMTAEGRKLQHATTEGLVSRRGMMGATVQRPSANPGRSSAPVSLRQNDAPSTMEVQRQRKLPGSNMLSTYFLVTSSESPNPREPVCIPFDFFKDADDFLDKMEETLGDEASRQLYNEMPSLTRRYAVVRLNWSGVSFVIRRGKPDLQALDYRVFCAWNAKDDGELPMIEFEIGVTLKPEV